MRKFLTVMATGLGLAAGFGTAAAQGADERLQVHGYLTQGIARSDTLAMLGIGDETTAEYRSAALQFRYAITGADNLLLQFSHRTLGTSPLTQGSGSVELDWAFYQRALGPVDARIGRIPIPTGIYNETRDVGTLLPFFRAPASVYQEGLENIDGASLAADLSLGAWSTELTTYGGAVEVLDVAATPQGAAVQTIDAKRVLGAQLWINTPLTGVRAGLNAIRYDADMGLAETVDGSFFLGSLDLNRSEFLVRAEYNVLELEGMTRITSWYAQGSVRAYAALWLNAQTEFVDTEAETPMGTMEQETLRDHAAGVRYLFSPQLVVKGEVHRRTGYDFDSFVDPTGAAAEAVYGILSVSVAF